MIRRGARTAVGAGLVAAAAAAACRDADQAGAPARPTTQAPAAARDRPATGTMDSGGARHAERERDLTGDGRPERITVDATGPRDDSLTVRVAIRTAVGDTLLWADSWPSALYFKYVGPPAALPPDSVRRTVRARLDALLADAAFEPLPEAAAPRTAADAARLDAVRYDVAEHEVRQARAVPLGDPLPADAHDAVEAAARAPATTSRATTLLRELRDRPTFRYHAGGEARYAVAWSPRERRFVRVYGCC